MTFRVICAFLVSGLLLISCGEEENREIENSGEESIATESGDQMGSPDTSAADWQLRLDYPDRGSKGDITINPTDNGYHIVAGPRAIYYKEGQRAQVPYRFKATFTQNNKPGPEGYGLFVAGENLDQEDQRYLYFLIRQDGKYLIKRRVGAETVMVVDWTSNEAIESVDEVDSPVNTLAVRAQADSLHFRINDRRVQTLSLEKLKYVEGLAGLRINHKLDLNVEDISLQAE